MKNLLLWTYLIVNLLCRHYCLGDEPSIVYAKDMPSISESAKSALAGVLNTSNVKGCTITSTARTSAQQAKAMYDFIAANGVGAARKLYGSEGNLVIDVYVTKTAALTEQSEILAAMEAKVKDVLPDAIKHNHMMHVDRPDFDVFDVSLDSIPSDKRDDFSTAAKASGLFYRVLGPDEGEKNCFHFEFKKIDE
jgi:hypothetical protein